MLGKNFCRQNSETFFSYFIQKIGFETSSKLSPKKTICVTGVILEGNLGEKVSLSWLTSPYLKLSEGEVKMYRMYREIQNLDHNFSQKS